MSRDFLEVWLMPNYTGYPGLSSENINFLQDELGLRIHVKSPVWGKVLRDLYSAYKYGNPPDVIQAGTTWISTMAHMGYLAQVPSTFERPKALTGWMENYSLHNGIEVAVPWLVETSMLIARKDILNRMGIVGDDIRTLIQFKEVCIKTYNEHLNSQKSIPLPYAFSLRAEHGKLHHLIPWFWTNGFEIPDLYNMPDKPFNLDNIYPSLESLKSVYISSHFPREDASAHRNVINNNFHHNGKYVFIIEHWYNIILSIVNPQSAGGFSNFQLEAFGMPVGPHGPAPNGTGSMLAVSSISRHKDEAWKLVKFLTGETYFNERISNCGDLPALETDFWKMYTDNPQIDLIRKQIDASRTYPRHPLWASYERVLNEGFTKLLWYHIYENKPPADLNIVVENMNSKFRELSSLAWELYFNA